MATTNFPSIVLAILGLQATAAAADPSPFAATVQIYNDAGAPKAEVDKAEYVAGRLFHLAGIKIHWVECTRAKSELCEETNDPALFVMRIETEVPPDHGPLALGFALLGGRMNHASVLYRRAAIYQTFPELDQCPLLGYIIAHELAHLFFRTKKHGEGLMHAAWTRSDMMAMKENRLMFSYAQGRELRMCLAQRTESVMAVNTPPYE